MFKSVYPSYNLFLVICSSEPMEQPNIDRLNIEGEVDMEFNILEYEENAIDMSLCLMGHFLANRSIWVPMKERMVEVWRHIGEITIDELQPNHFLFLFYHKVDVQRVLKGGP